MLIPKVKLFAWKLIRGRLPTKENHRKTRMRISGDCPFCDSHPEDIDHLFRQCAFIKQVWSTITNLCPTPV